MVVNDKGEPIWLERSLFEVVDDWIPEGWVRKQTEDNWSFTAPGEFIRGFFERWHDGDPAARAILATVYDELWLHYRHELSGQRKVIKR